MDFSFSLLFSLIIIISLSTTLSHSSPHMVMVVDHHQVHTTTSHQALDLWCVAKNNAADSALQSALDWACGPGGANCGPIQQGGPCYDPTDIQKTASYAFNDYFLNHGLTDDSCNFDSTAALTSLNPSHKNCKFPSSSTVKNGSFTGSSTVGVGPASADTNASNCIAGRWGWALITIHSFIAIALTF